MEEGDSEVGREIVRAEDEGECAGNGKAGLGGCGGVEGEEEVGCEAVERGGGRSEGCRCGGHFGGSIVIMLDLKWNLFELCFGGS